MQNSSIKRGLRKKRSPLILWFSVWYCGSSPMQELLSLSGFLLSAAAVWSAAHIATALGRLTTHASHATHTAVNKAGHVTVALPLPAVTV